MFFFHFVHIVLVSPLFFFSLHYPLPLCKWKHESRVHVLFLDAFNLFTFVLNFYVTDAFFVITCLCIVFLFIFVVFEHFY